MGIFDFMSMANNYEQRLVDNYEDDILIVDTCLVTDGEKQYETAIQHPDYYKDKWIVVEAYDTKEEAQVGHDKWVKIMTTEPLPEQLVDCCNSAVGQLAATFGVDFTYKRFTYKTIGELDEYLSEGETPIRED